MIFADKIINKNEIGELTRKYYKESLFILLAQLEEEMEALRMQRADLINFLDHKDKQFTYENNKRLLNITLAINDKTQKYDKIYQRFSRIPN